MITKKPSLTKKEQQFIDTVWNYYEENGRHGLPWRKNKKPYNILVSELMLQQTQVDRVVPKYKAFMKRWPTARQLAGAPLGEVLKEWQGLGYNRRAKFLHQTAVAVTNDFKGVFPKTVSELLLLPGVGSYTASAIAAFAYNQPVVLIETNVRQVYIHHFFNDTKGIDDKELSPVIEKTLPTERSGEWYAALMDYGTHLKKVYGNNTSKSKQYQKQSKFKGSDREVRGKILKALSEKAKTFKALSLEIEDQRLETQLSKLESEGMVVKVKTKYSLPT